MANAYQPSDLGGKPIATTGYMQAVPYAPSPLPGATPQPGSTLPISTPAAPTGPYKPSPLDYTAHLESGDRNIHQQIYDINTAHGHPAQGNWQFIVPTWQRMAPKAGVDINQYPTPMSAPRSVQAQVAAVTPGTEFGPRTQAGLRAMYPGIDLSKPLGYYGGTAGGYQPGSGASSPSAAPAQPNNVASALLALNGPGANVDLKPTTDALNRIANPDTTQAPQPAPLAPQQAAASMGNARQMEIAAQAAQLAAQTRLQAAQPLSWSTQPFGSMAGARTPGTTLTSVGGM